ALQRRLKVAAALKGISMREYVTQALGKVLDKDAADMPLDKRPISKEWLDELDALRSEIFKDRTLPGDSTDLIREAREERARQLEQR
ncbi:MAG: hypothetical protein WD645_04025, partial [Dehalococcoidia bacterium]